MSQHDEDRDELLLEHIHRALDDVDTAPTKAEELPPAQTPQEVEAFVGESWAASAEQQFNKAYAIGYRHGFSDARWDALDAIFACQEKGIARRATMGADEWQRATADEAQVYKEIREAIRALKPDAARAGREKQPERTDKQ